MTEIRFRTRPEVIEEVIWAGFPEGHVALRNPRQLAEVVDEFITEQNRPLADLATDPVVLNHVAYRMARPDERLDDNIVETYCDLAEYVLRALAMAE